MKTLLLLLLFLLALPVRSQVVTVSWSVTNAPLSSWTNLSYKLYCGTNSHVYKTNWLFAALTNSIAVTNFFPGTNYLAVAALVNYGTTNAGQSDLSPEVTFFRAPALTLGVQTVTILDILQSSTNLLAGFKDTGQTNVFYAAKNLPQQFWRTRLDFK